MPVSPAEIVPLLTMPPRNVETVADPLCATCPPTKIPSACAEIVPPLAMPPEK